MSGECDRFGRYLIGVRPGDYVCRAYRSAIERFPERFDPAGRLDRALLRLTSTRVIPLRAVDIAARFLCPAAAVRRRLVLLTALLECAPGTFERYEAPDVGKAGFALGLATRGVVSALALAIGVLAAAIAFVLAGGGE